MNTSVVEQNLEGFRTQIQEVLKGDEGVRVMNEVFRDIDEDQDSLISEEEVII